VKHGNAVVDTVATGAPEQPRDPMDRYELARRLYETCDREGCWSSAELDERDRFLEMADVAIAFLHRPRRPVVVHLPAREGGRA
jgi:hypothetical protein